MTSSHRRSALASIVYPAVVVDASTEPAELACRYFDPEPITVPDDPGHARDGGDGRRRGDAVRRRHRWRHGPSEVETTTLQNDVTIGRPGGQRWSRPRLPGRPMASRLECPASSTSNIDYGAAGTIRIRHHRHRSYDPAYETNSVGGEPLMASASHVHATELEGLSLQSGSDGAGTRPLARRRSRPSAMAQSLPS